MAGKVAVGGDIHVGCEEREVDALGEAGEGFGAAVEFVMPRAMAS